MAPLMHSSWNQLLALISMNSIAFERPCIHSGCVPLLAVLTESDSVARLAGLGAWTLSARHRIYRKELIWSF